MGVMWPWEKRVALTGDVTVESVKEDPPKFMRKYRVRVAAHTMTITVRSSMGLGRWASGKITQPNGRWVLFDPDRIADKIIDPDLVPLIEARCAEIKALDAQFVASAPKSFTDERGVVWTRS